MSLIVADVGGTNARLAFQKNINAEISLIENFLCSDFKSLEETYYIVNKKYKHYIDITQELAPGRFSGEFVTVPQQLIELSGPTDSVNLADVPDSMKREDSVDVKPKELQDEDTSSQDSDMMTDPTKQTGTDDRVNKSLADTNTTLPGATGAKSYTANYM